MRRILIALVASAAMVSFASAQTATTTATSTEMFVTAQPTDVLSYNLVGLNIVDGEDKTIGEIKDLIISEGQLSGFIVSVGGFLGMGEKYVIVSPASIDVTYSETDKKWAAKMSATKEAVEKAPEFKYEGRWAK